MPYSRSRKMEGDTSDSDTNPDTNTEPEPKSQPKNYNPFDVQITEIDSMLAEMRS
ncbi:1383_t:CDS:2 [Entrophospora sp. SA101]|nr:1383_t:CDS:2 [Entrophospora sp. SA101]